jgi:sphinganine C4-monooxygenase
LPSCAALDTARLNMAGANATSYDLPPLPAYTLEPLPPLYSWVSDAFITAALPVIGYWVVSLMFHAIDVYDLFPQYRLHTPAEVLKRNHVSRYEVLRDVIFQQVIQVIFSLGLAVFDESPTTGKAEYDVAWYAQKLRLAQRAVPYALTTLGLNPTGLATKLAESQPTLASVVMGGRYPDLLQTASVAGQQSLVPAFASWELSTASALYWFAIPAAQFAAAIVIIDAWEYMLHRAMHMNKWLYGKSYLQAPFSQSLMCPSDVPLPPPPTLRPLRIRCPVQPPSRGLCSGHPRRWPGLSAYRNDDAPIHVVLHWVNHQDCP